MIVLLTGHRKSASLLHRFLITPKVLMLSNDFVISTCSFKLCRKIQKNKSAAIKD